MSITTLGASGRAWLQQVEGLRLQPYDDQTGRPTQTWLRGATIGYGHLISESEWKDFSNGITQEHADSLFQRDLQPFERTVSEVIHVPLQQHQFDALLILCYNIGVGAFRSSSVVKLVNDPTSRTHYVSLEHAWKAWNRSQGKVMRGLANRRDAEWRMFEQGIYEHW